MKKSTQRATVKQFFGILVTCLLIAALAACAATRKATYPQGFVYLDHKQVHTAMQKMAISIDKLNRLLDGSTNSSNLQKQKVIEELNVLDEVTRDLGTDAAASNHQLLVNNMGAFRAQVSMARSAVESDPADFYLAGRLVGQCVVCHVNR